MPNNSFSGYQYETSPRKLEPEYEPQKKKEAKRKSSPLNNPNVQPQKQSKRKLKSHVKVVMYVGIIFAVLFAISYRNSLINESFSKNEKLKSKLALTQKENEQLQVNIENSLNLSNIEKLAKEKLGMQKLDNSQKIYVSLPKKDYIEPAVEEVVLNDTELNWFQKIIKFFTNE